MNTEKIANDNNKISKSYGERNDCGVRALANSCHIPYPQAHNIIKKNGRKKGRGSPKFNELMHTICDRLYYPKLDESNSLPKTIGQFCKVYKKGRYIIYTYGHALAVVDGVPQDWTTTKSRHRVIQFGKIKDEAIRMTNETYEKLKKENKTNE